MSDLKKRSDGIRAFQAVQSSLPYGEQLDNFNGRDWKPDDMTMRDHFALAALTGLLAWSPEGTSCQYVCDDAAANAYRMADAMMARRLEPPFVATKSNSDDGSDPAPSRAAPGPVLDQPAAPGGGAEDQHCATDGEEVPL